MKLLVLSPDTAERGGRGRCHSNVGKGVPATGIHRRRAVPPRIIGLFGIGRLVGSGLTRSTSTKGGSST